MRVMKRFLDSRSFGLSIVLLLGILGLVLALGWVNISSAYESPLEGEIDISFVNSHDRPAVRIVVKGNHNFIMYYRGEIVDGEKTICHPVGKSLFDLASGTGHSEGNKLFHDYTENDKTFYLNKDNYDYVCFLIGWGTWDGDKFAESYGPYRMGSDVTADNYDDLLEQTEEEETTPDNPPILVIHHNNTALSVTATDDNLNSDSWQNAGPFAAEPDCESGDLTYSPTGSDQYSLTLTTADNSQWYCFKVSDMGNNTGYIKYQVTGVVVEEEETTPDNPPILVIHHNNTALSVTATDDNLNSDSWQNTGPFAAEPDCESEDLTYSPAGSDQYSLTLTTADNDQWYCFKVSDTGNNTGYVKYQVKGVFIEEGVGNNNPNQADTDDNNEMSNENNPDRDDSNNGGSVSRQDTGSGGSSNGNPQRSSTVATTTPSESVSTGGVGDGGDTPDIPDTGIADEQGWLQLLGIAIMLAAVLGSVRILIMKKKHQRA